MRIQVAIPEAHVSADVLDAALESVTRLNEKMLAEGTVKPWRQTLREKGIRWKPEPPGQEHFDHAGIVTRRGFGDCDDLAPYAASSLRHSGEDPGAKAIVYRSGPSRWHAVVQRSDGTIEDPSKDAGMGRSEGVIGACVPCMATPSVIGGAYIVRPQIALRRLPRGWQARADIPWNWRENLARTPLTEQSYNMASLHASPVAANALVGAIDGAVELAEASGFASPDHLDRLGAIADAIDGAPYDELVVEYGPEHAQAAMDQVVGFFGGLKKLVKKVAPFASKAISFVPGVGPVASIALEQGAKLIPNDRPRPRPSPAAPFMPPSSAFAPQGTNLRCVPF